jgi:hypothetical protein
MMGRAGIRDPEPRFVAEALTQRKDNPRLADASLPGQQHDLTFAAFGHLPAIEQESEFVFAADQWAYLGASQGLEPPLGRRFAKNSERQFRRFDPSNL